jgi:hypothetical protein
MLFDYFRREIEYNYCNILPYRIDKTCIQVKFLETTWYHLMFSLNYVNQNKSLLQIIRLKAH